MEGWLGLGQDAAQEYAALRGGRHSKKGTAQNGQSKDAKTPGQTKAPGRLTTVQAAEGLWRREGLNRAVLLDPVQLSLRLHDSGENRGSARACGCFRSCSCRSPCLVAAVHHLASAMTCDPDSWISNNDTRSRHHRHENALLVWR